MAKRRPACNAALLHRDLGKRVVALGDQGLQHRIVRVARLDHHHAPRTFATGTPGYLQNQLAHLFKRAKVSAKQPSVRIEYADQGQRREVMPLGQHLRTHEQPRSPADSAIQLLLQCPFFARTVAINSRDLHIRESLGQCRSDALGPMSHAIKLH